MLKMRRSVSLGHFFPLDRSVSPVIGLVQPMLPETGRSVRSSVLSDRCCPRPVGQSGHRSLGQSGRRSLVGSLVVGVGTYIRTYEPLSLSLSPD
jgi:hypothetical protein